MVEKNYGEWCLGPVADSFDSGGADLGIEGFSDAIEIGRGGFGVVYRARETDLNRDVAVKILSGSPVDDLDDETRRRFERERVALGSLSDHPNIVTVYRTGVSERMNPFLAMEFVPGGTLAERCLTGDMDWSRVVDIVIKLCGALETAHRRSVVHRDIKPENVLLSASDEPLLSDFGVAITQGAAETRSGVITASINHAAPEILGGARPSASSDVYSLASTMHMAITGRAPFRSDTDETFVQLISRIAVQPPPDLRPLGVPNLIAQAVERGMSKETDVRFRSAEEFGRALQEAQVASGMVGTAMTITGEADSAPEISADVVDGSAPAAKVGMTVAQSAEEQETPSGDDTTGRRRRLAAVVLLLGVLGVFTLLLITREGDEVAKLGSSVNASEVAVSVATTRGADTDGSAATTEDLPSELSPPLPDFVGGSRDDAYTWLNSNGLVGICCHPSDGGENISAFAVLSQQYPPGSEVPLGTNVRIVSHDPIFCAANAGECEPASATAEAASSGQDTTTTSSSAASVTNSTAATGTTAVSEEPTGVAELAPPLPNFVGGSRDDAHAWLVANGLVEICCSPAVGAGTHSLYEVLTQEYPPGTELAFGTVVGIVSHDPGYCDVNPDECQFFGTTSVTTTSTSTTRPAASTTTTVKATTTSTAAATSTTTRATTTTSTTAAATTTTTAQPATTTTEAPNLAPPLPNFVGGTRDAAYNWMNANGLLGVCCTPTIGPDSAAVFEVLSQQYSPGTRLPLGTKVWVVSHDPGFCAISPDKCV